MVGLGATDMHFLVSCHVFMVRRSMLFWEGGKAQLSFPPIGLVGPASYAQFINYLFGCAEMER